MHETAESYSLSLIDKLAMAQVEPFGMHLYEVILYLVIAILCFFILLSLRKIIVLRMSPSADDVDDAMERITIIQVKCLKCEWEGRIGSFMKECPKCGGKDFAA